MRTFTEFMTSTDVVVFDGAIGTELERRGLAAPLPLWTGDAAARAPELLHAVHFDHLRAGADVVTANTFRTAPYSLARVGRESDAAALTRDGVAIARAACAAAGRGFVAGSIGPLEDCFHPERVPADAVLRREHARHVRDLVDAGVDLVLIETVSTAREAHAAAEAALVSGLPVFVSLIAAATGGGDLLSGEDLEVAFAHLRALEPGGRQVAGFLVNCTPPPVALAALERMDRPADPRPIGARPNLGRVTAAGSWDPGGATPAEFAAWGVQARALGARLLGGCCGTTPAHIAALATAVRR
jgi:S-methylmethionine-dependent homocysteine/selenocysteine methylase